MVNNVTQALPVPLCKLGATGNDHLLLNWLKTKDSLYNAVIRTKGNSLDVFIYIVFTILFCLFVTNCQKQIIRE